MAPQPPTSISTTVIRMINPTMMMIICTKSVSATAHMPPSIVYVKTITAPMMMPVSKGMFVRESNITPKATSMPATHMILETTVAIVMPTLGNLAEALLHEIGDRNDAHAPEQSGKKQADQEQRKRTTPGVRNHAKHAVVEGCAGSAQHHGTTKPGGHDGHRADRQRQAASGDHELGHRAGFCRGVVANTEHAEHVHSDAGEDDVLGRHRLFFLFLPNGKTSIVCHIRRTPAPRVLRYHAASSLSRSPPRRATTTDRKISWASVSLFSRQARARACGPTCPKYLQPLAGRPLLSHVLATAGDIGAADVCVVYGHGGDAVPAAIGDDTLRWALQSEQLGTGHAVQQAMPGTPDENQVLILFGDVPLLTPGTLSRLLEQTGPDDVAILSVELDDPTGYGRIVRDGNKVTGIVEQKDASEAEQAIAEINTGVMVCPGGKLRSWLNELGNDNAQGEYYLTDVVAMAVAEGINVKGIKADNWTEVMGINDKKQLAEAERALQARLVDELMAQGVGFADPARVDIRGKLECGKDVFIDVNAVFEGDVTLGDGTTVESNNLIRDSRLGSNTVVHSNCHIEGADNGRQLRDRAICPLAAWHRAREQRQSGQFRRSEEKHDCRRQQGQSPDLYRRCRSWDRRQRWGRHNHV